MIRERAASPYALGAAFHRDGFGLAEAREAGSATMIASDEAARAYGAAAAEEGWLEASRLHIQRTARAVYDRAERSDAHRINGTLPQVAAGAFLLVGAVLLFLLSAGW